MNVNRFTTTRRVSKCRENFLGGCVSRKVTSKFHCPLPFCDVPPSMLIHAHKCYSVVSQLTAGCRSSHLDVVPPFLCNIAVLETTGGEWRVKQTFIKLPISQSPHNDLLIGYRPPNTMCVPQQPNRLFAFQS